MYTHYTHARTQTCGFCASGRVVRRVMFTAKAIKLPHLRSSKHRKSQRERERGRERAFVCEGECLFERVFSCFCLFDNVCMLVCVFCVYVCVTCRTYRPSPFTE